MRPRVIHRIDEGGRTSAREWAPHDRTLRPAENHPASAESAELWIGAHIPDIPTRTLEQLALRAQRFTPRVSLVAPDGLLLEVRGSLHLFNGIPGLLAALANECGTIEVSPVLALAPTPLAAIVAARASKQTSSLDRMFVVTERGQLVGQLSRLPLAPLRWPQAVVERLARMGVRTIGQALRLPRAGFARRFGAGQLAELDRLTGRSADLRHRFEPRQRFRRRRELTYELENNATILGALAPLLADLGVFLRARQCGVLQLECLLRHRHAPPSKCLLGLGGPVADVERLTELLGERLSALSLPEPVRSVELRSGPLVKRVLVSDALWQPGEHGGQAGPQSGELIERLRARLGPEAVYGLQVLAGHRPENAWSVSEPTEEQSDTRDKIGPWPAFRRPLWLLRAPQLLDELDGMPRRDGPLRLFGDVERVETGWWDGGDIGRDYYKAFDSHGVKLWIFRERATAHRWFLHGIFG